VGEVEQAITAIRAGNPVLLPTDTVYGLCTTAYGDDPTWRLYELKGRDERQPTALLAGSVEILFECIPELRGDIGVIVRTLLPGSLTLVLPNAAGRFRWLTGERADAIGVRVPNLQGAAREVLDEVGCVVATSANDPGGPDPRSLDDVPERIRAGCSAEVDAGPLPGTPSTVIDFTGREPVVLRDGAVPADEALARVREALAT